MRSGRELQELCQVAGTDDEEGKQLGLSLLHNVESRVKNEAEKLQGYGGRGY